MKRGEGGRLLTFSAFRMGAYLRWALNSRLGAYSNKYGIWLVKLGLLVSYNLANPDVQGDHCCSTSVATIMMCWF